MSYILAAIRRNKDNNNLSGKELCIRHIIKDEKDINILKYKASVIGFGVWRIYRTVNKRDFIRAKKALIHYLIDNEEKYFIESIWKTILLKPENKAENKFLLDIDADYEKYKSVIEYLIKSNIDILEENKTPNGFHIITNGFDTREIINKFDFLEIKKDALFFIEQFRV